MIHNYPYTNFHEINLDYILDLANRALGIHLEVVGNKLQMKNQAGEVISNVTISYATSALEDADGNDIRAYLIGAGAENNKLVFVKGNDDTIELTVPYSTKADKDTNGNSLTGYVSNVTIQGDKVRITKGDSTYTEITIPFATKASKDGSGNLITTYACTLETDGDEIVLRDRDGRELDSITVPYASEAGHAEEADHADEADEAATADTATHSTNSVESIVISGDTIKFTTYGGTTTTITVPYALKALGDSLGNEIKSTYVADVTNNATTGEITFYDAEGNEIASLTPTVDKATHDSYNNTIADYIKSIVTSSSSNYITVTTGRGNTTTLTVNYATTAWKDTNGNVIKNTYIKRLDCVEDTEDGHYKLVAYNGDTPEAELFRIEITAYYAQEAGHALTADNAGEATYVTNGVKYLSESTSVYGVKSLKANKQGGGTTNPDIIEKTIINIPSHDLNDVVEMEVGDKIRYFIEWAEDSIKTAYDNGAKIQIVFHEHDYTTVDEIEYIDLTSMHYDSNNLFEAYFTIGTGFYKFYNDNSDLYVIEKISEAGGGVPVYEVFLNNDFGTLAELTYETSRTIQGVYDTLVSLFNNKGKVRVTCINGYFESIDAYIEEADGTTFVSFEIFAFTNSVKLFTLYANSSEPNKVYFSPI